MTRVLTIVAAVVLALSLTSCGGDEAATTTTADGAATSTTVGEGDVSEQLVARLTDEFGDAETAQAVVAQLDPTILEQFSTTVAAQEIASTPLLSYRLETQQRAPDTLVALSFGNRVAPDGTVTAGPTNEALADAVQSYVAANPVPVYAQWEIARILQERKVPDVVSIEPKVDADGNEVYLSTSGVTDQIVDRAEANGSDLGVVGMVCHADHLGRCVMTAEASGMDPVVVVDGIDLPTQYDPESGQQWTRDRVTYLTLDLSGRLATA